VVLFRLVSLFAPSSITVANGYSKIESDGKLGFERQVRWEPAGLRGILPFSQRDVAVEGIVVRAGVSMEAAWLGLEKDGSRVVPEI
jgi:hypothetical protein